MLQARGPIPGIPGLWIHRDLASDSQQASLIRTGAVLGIGRPFAFASALPLVGASAECHDMPRLYTCGQVALKQRLGGMLLHWLGGLKRCVFNARPPQQEKRRTVGSSWTLKLASSWRKTCSASPFHSSSLQNPAVSLDW